MKRIDVSKKDQSARVDRRSALLASMAKEIEQNGGFEDLVVGEGETRVLSYSSEQCKPYYRTIQIDSVDKLKEIIGVPDQLEASKRISAQMTLRSVAATRSVAKPVMASLQSMDISKLRARSISPMLLREGSAAERIEASSLARLATKAYLYGQSAEVSHWAPLINEYLVVSKAKIIIPFIFNITVGNGGTLTIAADTHAIYANKIRLYGTGKIDCRGPTTFDCTSFEGFL